MHVAVLGGFLHAAECNLHISCILKKHFSMIYPWE
jgi:hypothetical protein